VKLQYHLFEKITSTYSMIFPNYMFQYFWIIE